MNIYDDYAVSPSNFEKMAKEYSLQSNGKILSLKAKQCEISQDDVDALFAKIEYLRVLVGNLKNRTNNTDVLLVLNNISSEIATNVTNLSGVLNGGVKTFEREDQNYEIFCNNLKLSINTTGDIIKLLIKIKDDDVTFQFAPKLTDATDSFIDINNQLVSLFGDCRYRNFSLFSK